MNRVSFTEDVWACVGAGGQMEGVFIPQLISDTVAMGTSAARQPGVSAGPSPTSASFCLPSPNSALPLTSLLSSFSGAKTIPLTPHSVAYYFCGYADPKVTHALGSAL